MKYGADEKYVAILCGKARIQILRSIRREAKNVTELSKELHMNQSTLSHNLALLEKCRYVKASPHKKFRYYSINGRTIEIILDMIDKHVAECCKNQGERK